MMLADAECKRTRDGTAYKGKRNTSISGSSCRAWSEFEYEKDLTFPEKSREAAINFCRNPNRDPRGPWCYVNELDVEYCDVPFCGRYRRGATRCLEKGRVDPRGWITFYVDIQSL